MKLVGGVNALRYCPPILGYRTSGYTNRPTRVLFDGSIHGRGLFSNISMFSL
jgi:hypothetical protein